jgi:hypothetical protein
VDWGHKDPQTFHLTRSSLCHRPCLWEMAIAAGSTQGSKAGLGSFITRTNSHKITRASIWWAQANPWAHMSDVPKLLQLLQGSRWFYCPTFGESCYRAARQTKSRLGFWSSVLGLGGLRCKPFGRDKELCLDKTSPWVRGDACGGHKVSHFHVHCWNVDGPRVLGVWKLVFLFVPYWIWHHKVQLWII